MIAEKKRLNIDDIEILLHGSDPEEGIRYIDVNYYSNEAKLFIRNKNDKNVTVKTDTFRPFVWFKGFDFEESFQWNYFSIPICDYDLETNCILHNGVVRNLVDEKETLEIVGTSPNELEVFLREFISNISDRKKLCYAKMKEFGITIEEAITGTNKNLPISRLEEGFKYLVHINPPKETANYTNPHLAYTKTGILKKHRGSFSNLIDFFQEGGLDMWKKSGVFIDRFLFKEWWSKSTPFQKMLFFLGFPMKNQLFSFVDRNKIGEELIKILDSEENQFFSEINYQGLIDLTFSIFNEKVRESKIFEFYEKKIQSGDFSFIEKYLTEFSNTIVLKPDNYKLDQIVEDDFSFESKKGFTELNKLFIANGINFFFGEERLFFNLSPLEQYMIQSGKRLFKGIEEYTDLRIMTMDIETKALESYAHRNDAALFPHMGRIFKIGIMCNNGYEEVLNASNDAEEISIIEQFFAVVCENDPDLFLTYNGEMFDFPFILKRYEYLKSFKDEEETLTAIRELLKIYYDRFEGIYISSKQTFNRRAGNLKVGGSSERYVQTNILGINLCDTMFAVKRAAAINKSIPNFKLKDNVKHAKLAKKNRVYVDGGKIGAIENSPSDFYLNPENGDWIKYHKEILFEKNPYNQGKIKKRGQSTFIYDNENTLYLWDAMAGDGQFMGTCNNTLEFTNDIDGFFNTLYEKFKAYDSVCFQQAKFIGFWLKDELPEVYALLTNKLKELRGNLSNKEKFFPDKDFNKYKCVQGSDIIKQYLIDDLWETVKLDEHYSQATFLISKWLPTSYQRAATMGGASVWKLLLSTYSYTYGLGIPEFDEPREFSGGLVAMLSCGWHGKSFKGDFSSLYPAEFYNHVKSPEIDLFGVYKLFMYYGWSTRIKYKKLMNEHKDKGEMELSKKFDVRQMPIKILINSFYGMMGAAGVTPFADLLVAQGITCNGRQHLRHVIKWFTDRGFFATIAHTDGVFFAINTADLNYTYIGRGINWLVEKEKTYTGIAAYVAEYNDLFMKGIMGLDIDEIVESVINFSKGNYIYYKVMKNKLTGELTDKMEIVGGAIIKKTQSEYITQFVETDVIPLLKNKPLDFIQSYWSYINKINKKELDVKLIASKAKIKKSKAEYLEHIKGVNKNGQPLNRQVYMELLIQNNLDFESGDIVYYINTGISSKDKDSESVNTTFATCEIGEVSLQTIDNVFKSNNRDQIKKLLLHLDVQGFLTINKKLDGGIEEILSNIKTWKNVKFKVKNLKKGIFVDFIKTEYIINCSLIDSYKPDEKVNYNSDLYVSKFNSAVHPLFVCFKPELRDKLIINKIEDKPFILESDLQLINSLPFAGHEANQASYEDVMIIAEEEMEYWNTIQTDPKDFLIERK